MSFFVQSSAASKPKTRQVRYASIALTAIFIVLAVAQLYSYEDFPDVIASMWLPGGRLFASIWAAIIVILEVAALPFLLSFQLSLAMRVVSMVAAWIALAFWLVISIWETTSVNALSNGGILGATVSVAPGWWLVGTIVALGIMMAYVSWGMWPRRSHVE